MAFPGVLHLSGLRLLQYTFLVVYYNTKVNGAYYNTRFEAGNTEVLVTINLESVVIAGTARQNE